MSYAVQLNSLGGPGIQENDFVACSGAQVRDLFAVTGNHEYNVAGSEPAQVNRLSQQVGLVTMTMGGNDLGIGPDGGLASLIKYCIDPRKQKPCNTQLQTGVTEKLHALDGTRPGNTNPNDLVRVYEKLRLAAPNARILIAGYPHEFTGTYPNKCERFEPGDQAWMNQMVDQLNGVILANIQAANKSTNARIEYVNPVPLFAGHPFDWAGVCEWPGKAFNDESVFNLSENSGFFHPNALGQILYGVAFMDELRKPSPIAQQPPANICSSDFFLKLMLAKGAKFTGVAGPPKCVADYAAQDFTFPTGPTSNYPTYFFRVDSHGGWTVLGGGAIGDVTSICTALPANVKAAFTLPASADSGCPG